jgi:hypothetical protein
MPLIIPAGYAHVVHSYSLVGDNERMAYTYGVQLDPANDPQNLNGVAQVLHDLTKAKLWDLPSNQYALESTELMTGGTPANPAATGIHVARSVGTGANAHLPQNCATLIHKRTALGGRRNRGRLNFIPPAESSVANNGVIDPASVAGYQDRFSAWLQEMRATLAVVDMVVLHSAGISVPPNPSVVTALTVDPVITTQRKRLR